MKPLSPAMRDRAIDALNYVLEQISLREDPDVIIAGLTSKHRATLRYSNGTHMLRCAGIVVSNTSSQSACLLGNWRRGAVLRLSYLDL